MAFRTKRRRKPRVVWLPTFGLEQSDESATAGNPTGIQGRILLGDSSVIWDAFPLTFDESFSSQFQQDAEAPLGGETFRRTLQDLVSGNEYRLRRIVGKFFCAAKSDELDSPAAEPCLADVALGFIVCKTDDFGAPETDFNEVNPLAQDSMNDPWIWRRRWLLNPYGNSRTIDTLNDARLNRALELYPPTTAGYGSVLDGPHIDQKTARIIHREERLFAVVAARGLYQNPQTILGAETEITYLLDYRLLASLRSAGYGNRRNASR